jgi:hypothetical protein
MTNDADPNLDALLHAARSEDEHESMIARAELGFETRLMARIREENAASISVWAWKLAPIFAALALAAGVWSRTPTARTAADARVHAEAVSGGEERELVEYMTGPRE